MLESSLLICKIRCSHMKCERARGHKESGGTFNKLSRSESDKHQVSSVSGFHCESSKPEGSSLRRQLFHGVRAGLVFSRPSSFLGRIPPFLTAKMQNSLGEQRRPDQSIRRRKRKIEKKTAEVGERWRRFRQTSDSLIQSTRRRKYFTFRYHLMRSSKELKTIAGSRKMK